MTANPDMAAPFFESGARLADRENRIAWVTGLSAFPGIGKKHCRRAYQGDVERIERLSG